MFLPARWDYNFSRAQIHTDPNTYTQKHTHTNTSPQINQSHISTFFSQIIEINHCFPGNSINGELEFTPLNGRYKEVSLRVCVCVCVWLYLTELSFKDHLI